MNARAEAVAHFTRTHADYVKTPDMRIVDVISGLAGKVNQNLWVKVSYAKIQELLFKFTGRRLSVRHDCRRHPNDKANRSHLGKM